MDIRTLPKVELHCHLDGILGPEILRSIRQHDPAFPIVPGAFELEASPMDNYQSLVNRRRFIDLIEVVQTPFYPILAAYLASLKARNVRYTEIMIASSEIPRDTMEVVEKGGDFRE